MWRFSNPTRIFRSHINTPRSVPVQQLEEETEKEVQGKLDHGIHFTFGASEIKEGKKVNQHPRRGCKYREKVLYGFFTKWNESFGRNSGSSTGREKNKHQWWRAYDGDLSALLRGSNRLLEAIVVGTGGLLGADRERFQKNRVLYQMLYALQFSGGVNKSFNESEEILSQRPSIPTSRLTEHMAIKDAAGAAHDASVNITKSETLESVLEEFQCMCQDYSAQANSICGIQCAQNGNISTAIQNFRKSCALGNSSACFNLGLCYETGNGVDKDLDKAEYYYKAAAKSGHIHALHNLGLLYVNLVEQDLRDPACHDKGIKLVEKAASQGLVEAQTYLGVHLMGTDPASAIPYFKAACDKNDSVAQYFLAICYEQGWGVTKNECRAAQLYYHAANGGHENAMYNLAVFNEHGLGGLPQDTFAAMELYRKAADLGSEEAKHRLDELQTEEYTDLLTQQKDAEEFFKELFEKHNSNRTKEKSQLRSVLSSPAIQVSNSFYFDLEYLNQGVSDRNRTARFQIGATDEEDEYNYSFDSGFMSISGERSRSSSSSSSSSRSISDFHRSYTTPCFNITPCTL